MLKWAFNGASLDQGLLTEHFVLHTGRVQLLDTENSPVPVQVYAPGYQHTGNLVAVVVLVVNVYCAYIVFLVELFLYTDVIRVIWLSGSCAMLNIVHLVLFPICSAMTY